MTTILGERHLRIWIQLHPQAVQTSAALAVQMDDTARAVVEAEIARRQWRRDADADVTDPALVADVLRDHGFHPAFGFCGVVTGQAAFEALRAQAPPTRCRPFAVCRRPA